MKNHYFFRFGTNNHLFHNFYKFSDNNNELVYKDEFNHLNENGIVLAIYYDNFTVKDIENLVLTKQNTGNIESGHKNNVIHFYKSPVGSYFWIFSDTHLLAFEQISDTPFCFPDDYDHYNDKYNNPHKTLAKCKKFKDPIIFNRFKVPEIFSTTDSSRIYGTLVLLNEQPPKFENCMIAQAMVSGTPINVPDVKAALRYLSPIQLETLFFKYFNDNGYIVTSHRGGSKYKVDIEIKDYSLKDSVFIPSFQIQIQVKRLFTDYKEIESYLDKGIYFATLSEIDLSKLKQNRQFFIGPDQIQKLLLQDNIGAKKTIHWIKEVLGYDYFDFKF